MAIQRELRVLVATDGSRDAQAAIATTMHFPWPARMRVRAISARRTGADYRRSTLLTALDRGAKKAADSARRTLSTLPGRRSRSRGQTPVEGILGEAEGLRADVIVVGWRGHGAVRRLLMGSVSRGVVRGSKRAVLVVRRSQRICKIVVGVDGSPTSKRALAFVGRLVPPRDGQVTLVSGVELMTDRYGLAVLLALRGETAVRWPICLRPPRRFPRLSPWCWNGIRIAKASGMMRGFASACPRIP